VLLWSFEAPGSSLGRRVVTTITQVLVAEDHPAFHEPRKFVGPPLSRTEAERKATDLGWIVREDRGRGWRRMVPSPRPRHILQHRMIGEAAREGPIVIACDEGGIPVRVDGEGKLVGVEGVIDKDLTSGALAIHVDADLLVILTSVPHVMVAFDTPEERRLGALTLEEVERLHDEGHFPPGSMGPKVEAVINFLRAGGRRALVTDPEHLPEAREGRAVRNPTPPREHNPGTSRPRVDETAQIGVGSGTCVRISAVHADEWRRRRRLRMGRLEEKAARVIGVAA